MSFLANERFALSSDARAGTLLLFDIISLPKDPGSLTGMDGALSFCFWKGGGDISSTVKQDNSAVIALAWGACFYVRNGRFPLFIL